MGTDLKHLDNHFEIGTILSDPVKRTAAEEEDLAIKAMNDEEVRIGMLL